MDDKFWYLKNCDLFERLSPDEVKRIEAHAKVREFARGDMVYLPSDAGDAVLLLAAGRVRIYHVTGEGKQAVLALIDPGEVFGELALFEASQRDEFATSSDHTSSPT